MRSENLSLARLSLARAPLTPTPFPYWGSPAVVWQRARNCLKNAFDISYHIVVPEAQHTQPSISYNIKFVLRMLPTITFHEAVLPANDISGVRSDWLLPNECGSVKRTRAESTPKSLFSGRGILAQPPRDACFASFSDFRTSFPRSFSSLGARELG